MILIIFNLFNQNQYTYQINLSKKPRNRKYKQMSKQYQKFVNRGKDEQFQIHTLTQNSSESSTRRDRQYQIDYDNSSSQEQKAEVKSLQQLPEQRKQKQKQFISKKQGSQQSQDITCQYQKKQNENQVKIEKQQHRATDDLNYQGELQKKLKKRRKLFQNIKIYNKNNQKGVNNEHQPTANDIQKQKSMMNRVCFEKKRQNHSLIKIWNYQRIKKLQFHRTVIQQILKGVQSKLRQSKQNFELYRSFFMQKYQQQQQYSLQSAADVANENNTLESNRHSQDIYIACSRMFKILAKKQDEHKQICAQFAQFIQTKILKQIFQEYFDNIHKQFISYYDRIKVMKQQIKKIDEITCRKLINLETNFTQCFENVNQQLNKDFYQIQLSFLRKCESEMMVQSNYGRLILQFYESVLNLEKIRKILLEKSVKLYNQGLKKYQRDLKQISKSKNYGQNHIGTVSGQKVQNQITIQGDMNLIKQYYRIDNMLSPETLEQLTRKMSMQKHRSLDNINSIRKDQKQDDHHNQAAQKPDSRMQYNQLVRFLSKCEIQQFNSHHLIIKKFQIQIFKQQKWIQGQLTITVDKYVHVFLNAAMSYGNLVVGSRVFHKADFTLKIKLIQIGFPDDITENQSRGQMQNDNEDLIVVIKAKKAEGGLKKIASFLKINKNKEQMIRFSQQNDLVQFQDYIVQFSK